MSYAKSAFSSECCNHHTLHATTENRENIDDANATNLTASTAFQSGYPVGKVTITRHRQALRSCPRYQEQMRCVRLRPQLQTGHPGSKPSRYINRHRDRLCTANHRFNAWNRDPAYLYWLQKSDRATTFCCGVTALAGSDDSFSRTGTWTRRQPSPLYLIATVSMSRERRAMRDWMGR